jgi:hypothetical protein
LQVDGQYQFDWDGLQATIPLPYALLHFIPVVQANRAPNRNSVLLMLGLAVMAGFGVQWLLSWLGSRLGRSALRVVGPALVVVMAAGVLFEHAAIPSPLTEASVPEVYEQIARDSGDFSVMQLPLGWRTSFGPLGSERTQVEMYQTVHGKPIIGGNIARSPSFKMEYFGRIPLFGALAGLELYREPDEETDAAARAQAAELMLLYDVRYLVVLPPIPGRWPYQDTYARTWEYARDVLPLEPEPFYDLDGVRAYRIVQPELLFPFEVDLGTQWARPYRGEGWHQDEVIFGETANWASDRQAEIFFPLRDVGEHQLHVRLAPFTYAGAPVQTVVFDLNGQRLGEPMPLVEGWQVVELGLPAGAVRSGLNRLELHFAHTERPRDVLPASLAIGSTGLETPQDIEIDAAPDHAYISVTDEGGVRADASAGRRGYNVAVLDARSGRVLDKRGFDTWANAYEAGRLAEFIHGIPDGRIVVVATKGDAGRHLTGEAVTALREVGAQADLRGAEGEAHAVIGVKGAAPGSGQELVGQPSSWLRLGRNPDRRPLAVAMDWVRIGR